MHPTKNGPASLARMVLCTKAKPIKNKIIMPRINKIVGLNFKSQTTVSRSTYPNVTAKWSTDATIAKNA